MTARLSIILALAVLLVGCHERPARSNVPAPRVVSYSPAITGLIFGMGLDAHLVGVTKYCKIPPNRTDVKIVGDLARVSAESILVVEPDVVLVQQNPADFAAVAAINPHVRIEHFTIETLADIQEAMERIGKILSDEDSAKNVSNTFGDALASIRQRTAGLSRPKVLFVLGYDRPATGGSGTFIDEMIALAGATNAASSAGYAGWKTLNRENIQAMAPDVLICQVAPAQQNASEQYWQSLPDLPAVKAKRVYAVTDDRWTVPSAWSAELAEKLALLVHPELGHMP